ncbi:MAG: type secretion protein DotI [Gammaproteobacteria bacterium]|jgi:intracellular multiplication protein IcmL|nr:type secretion protein DotI [Gammaproteobacteria bacterium]
MTDTPNPNSPKQDEVLVAVNARNEFYRDSYRKVLVALNLAILCLIILVGAVIYVMSHPPQPKYFATYADGKLVPLIPLNQPNVSQAALLQWANTAVIAVNTYDFFNYREQLQKASEYFTPDGWQAYLNELKASRNLNAVLEKKLVVSAVATRAPTILREAILDGVYTWVVNIPILVTYQSASEYSQQSLIVTLMIKRISTLTNPNGIGITNYIAAEGYPDQETGQNINQAAQG